MATARTPRSALVVALVVAVVGPVPSLRAEPAQPATPTPRDDAGRCASCHPREVASWQASAHARSWSNTLFQAAYRVEPQAFCRGCHAPLADPARPPPPAGAAEGVGCVACHTAPHAPSGERREKDRENVAIRTRPCARCHEFTFPGAPLAGHAPTWMQRTAREHEESAAGRAGVTCVDCRRRRRANRQPLGDRERLRSETLGNAKLRRVPGGVGGQIEDHAPAADGAR